MGGSLNNMDTLPSTTEILEQLDHWIHECENRFEDNIGSLTKELYSQLAFEKVRRFITKQKP
jgi:hypothetical protein